MYGVERRRNVCGNTKISRDVSVARQFGKQYGKTVLKVNAGGSCTELALAKARCHSHNILTLRQGGNQGTTDSSYTTWDQIGNELKDYGRADKRHSRSLVSTPPVRTRRRGLSFPQAQVRGHSNGKSSLAHSGRTTPSRRVVLQSCSARGHQCSRNGCRQGCRATDLAPFAGCCSCEALSFWRLRHKLQETPCSG